MIRINLVDKKAKMSTASAASTNEVIGMSDVDIQKQGILRIIIILILPAALYLHQEMTLPDLINQATSLENKLNELREYNERSESSVQEINKFKEDEAKIQARILFLDKISRGRLSEIKVIDLIQQVIPEKVWLNRLEFKEGSLLMTGFAMSDFEISSFMESLAKSAFFSDVRLAGSVEQGFEGVITKQFEIICQTGGTAL